jgi:hypothetical protein
VIERGLGNMKTELQSLQAFAGELHNNADELAEYAGRLSQYIELLEDERTHVKSR